MQLDGQIMLLRGAAQVDLFLELNGGTFLEMCIAASVRLDGLFKANGQHDSVTLNSMMSLLVVAILLVVGRSGFLLLFLGLYFGIARRCAISRV